MAKNQLWLIDDDPITNVINEKTLAIHLTNYEVSIFDNPLTAQNTLLNSPNKPHCILLDLNMPLMEGWAFLDMMKAHNVSTTVVILTSSFYKEDMLRAKGYKNVKHFMTKPLNVPELKKVLKRI